MKKTNEQRIRIVNDYHCGAIERARHLIELVADDFFSDDISQMDLDARRLKEGQLLSGYNAIAAVLNTVSDILFNLETDLDAASGIETTCTEIRRQTMCAIYGLTEDKEEAAPSATNTQSGK